MPKLASKATRGFYAPEIHGKNMPADVVEITDEYHAELIEGQAQGKIIDWSGDQPVAVDPPPLTMPERRQQRLAAINAERDRREEAGFPYQGKVLDSNPRSVQRITTVVLAAQAALAAGQPFSQEWTCADNSTLVLDAAGVIGMPVALALHAATIHGHARALKAATVAAIDSDELDAIDILAGWPEVAA